MSSQLNRTYRVRHDAILGGDFRCLTRARMAMISLLVGFVRIAWSFIMVIFTTRLNNQC